MLNAQSGSRYSSAEIYTGQPMCNRKSRAMALIDRGPIGQSRGKKNQKRYFTYPTSSWFCSNTNCRCISVPAVLLQPPWTSHVLEVQRCSVVIVAAKLAREFASIISVVEVPELVRRHKEALVAEKANVVFGKLCEIAQERYITARVTLRLRRNRAWCFQCAQCFFRRQHHSRRFRRTNRGANRARRSQRSRGAHRAQCVDPS